MDEISAAAREAIGRAVRTVLVGVIVLLVAVWFATL